MICPDVKDDGMFFFICSNIQHTILSYQKKIKKKLR